MGGCVQSRVSAGDRMEVFNIKLTQGVRECIVSLSLCRGGGGSLCVLQQQAWSPSQQHATQHQVDTMLLRAGKTSGRVRTRSWASAAASLQQRSLATSGAFIVQLSGPPPKLPSSSRRVVRLPAIAVQRVPIRPAHMWVDMVAISDAGL